MGLPGTSTADASALLRTLDACRLRLKSEKRINVELRLARAALTRKIASLNVALAEAHRLAYYDPLTGLPNRRLLLDRFEQASALADRRCSASAPRGQRSAALALLFLDVDDFKGINDQLGHCVGDKLLREVAARLSSSMRKSDTACRYGGDEFVVLLSEVDDEDHAASALRKITDRLALSYVIDGYSIKVTISKGMATYPGEAPSFADLLRLSDRSMFSDKRSGRDRPPGDNPSSVSLRLATVAPQAV